MWKRLLAGSLMMALSAGIVAGCSERTRKDMGADVNRTARKVDDSLS